MDNKRNKRKYCRKCGTALDESTGQCPTCDAATPKSPKASSYNKKIKKEEIKWSKREERDRKLEKKRIHRQTRRKKAIRGLRQIILVLLLIAIIGVGAAGALTYFGLIEMPPVERLLYKVGWQGPSVDLEDYKVEPRDAEEYFQENSQIIAEIGARDSDNVLTEAKTIQVLRERGFKDFPVTTEYSIDGMYSATTEISDTSTVKHPIYQTNYISENGELWTVLIVEGDVIANPVSYNMQSTREAQLVISESDAVTSYDSTTNKFFKTIPDESALIVRVVERIDAETLETLTTEVIDEW